MGNILKKLRNKLYNLYRFTLPKLQLTLHKAASDNPVPAESLSVAFSAPLPLP